MESEPMPSQLKVVFSLRRGSDYDELGVRNWASPEAMIYGQALSVLSTSRFYGNIEFITDSNLKPFIDDLRLPVRSVTTSLDNIKHLSSEMWAAGKVYAYHQQTSSFMHLDNDVILTRRLGEKFERARIGVQSIEGIGHFNEYYRQGLMDIKSHMEIETHPNGDHYAYTCSAYVCNDMQFNQAYTAEATRVMMKVNELSKSGKLIQPDRLAIIYEQYVMASVARRLGLADDVEFLAKYYTPRALADSGLIHVWSKKKDMATCNRVIDTCRKSFPRHTVHIEHVIKKYLK